MTEVLQRVSGNLRMAQPIDPMALSLNENPFPPLAPVRDAIVGAIGAANRYPEFLPEQLRRIIAGHLGVSDEQVVIGAGATGVAMQVLGAVTTPGDRIVMADPTFDGYPIMARMARLASVTVPLDSAGHHDLEAMADAALRARVVVLCRPHNPSGTIESSSSVHRFLSRVPRDVIVLLDEAYIEFVAPGLRLDTRDLIENFPNVIVVRTFSKAYGLAGIRMGYGFCAADLARSVWAMQMPFGTAITNLAAVVASYEAENHLQRRVRAIAKERNYLRSRLRALGVDSSESHANFIYLPHRGKPWADVFAGTGLRVRSYRDGGVRVTVGGRTSSHAVLRAVAESTAH